MNARIGTTGLPASYVVKLWTSAAAGAAVAWAVKVSVPPLHPIVAATLILTPYGVVFFAMAYAFRLPEVANALARFGRLSRR
jgi:hypothetical protein